jgi:excisionase family DNA binding protein
VSNQRLLTLAEVADLLRLSPHTVRKMTRDGRLVPVRLCRRLLFSGEAVDRLIASGSPSPGRDGEDAAQ